jgi:hypothetical protein
MMSAPRGRRIAVSKDAAFENARERRFALHQAMLDLEHSMQSPSADPEWRDRLIIELRDLSEALEDHIETVEGAEGIIETAVARAPRTQYQGKKLRDDHPLLRQQLSSLLKRIEAAADLGEDVVVDLRGDVVELLVGLYRHRAQGSDFVWEAYDLDIGGLG